MNVLRLSTAKYSKIPINIGIQRTQNIRISIANFAENFANIAFKKKEYTSK